MIYQVQGSGRPGGHTCEVQTGRATCAVTQEAETFMAFGISQRPERAKRPVVKLLSSNRSEAWNERRLRSRAVSGNWRPLSKIETLILKFGQLHITKTYSFRLIILVVVLLQICTKTRTRIIGLME